MRGSLGERAATPASAALFALLSLSGCFLSHRADPTEITVTDAGSPPPTDPTMAPLGPPETYGERHLSVSATALPGPLVLCAWELELETGACVLLERLSLRECVAPGRRWTELGCEVQRDDERRAGWWWAPHDGYCREGTGRAVHVDTGGREESEMEFYCPLRASENPRVGGWRDGEAPPIVGRSCAAEPLSASPIREWDVHLTSPSGECAGLPCLTWGLTEETAAERVGRHRTCSCRCSSDGDSSLPLCECPRGTVCNRDVLGHPRSGLAGGWCVPCSDDWDDVSLPACDP